MEDLSEEQIDGKNLIAFSFHEWYVSNHLIRSLWQWIYDIVLIVVLGILFMIFINRFFEEFRAVFDLFNDRESDVLSIKNLERVLKTCGREPSSKELREVIRLVDPTGGFEFISIHKSLKNILSSYSIYFLSFVKTRVKTPSFS